ncbi:asparaginase [Thiomicrorhabdus sp. 6S2-11]|uniref:Asparaginase n=1 Tax=Thiomicrorhabdus marina TaxID=2818442 RepID=A0ABS3Q2M8_9GAMM|nr:asparaginase domain-containing protein [Thiomicrorhabdus marina]MBO1926591.1 asparaginase [Thiomicrorhabdus marina]
MLKLLSDQRVDIVITGGTLDKDYHPLQGELVFPTKDQPSHVEAILREANVGAVNDQSGKFTLHNLMQIDSLEMKAAQRKQIAEAILQCTSQHIVITHGTDTMVKTAKKLIQWIDDKKEFTALTDKTIVLTGAMRPFALGDSDASFNLGAALIAAQTLPAGVYICMNGNVHRGNEVIKDYQQGIFVCA